MTTTKLLPITTFVAAAMSFALPAYADDYTWAGEDSTIDTYVLGDFEETDDDSSAIQLGEKILKKNPLTFALYDTSAVSSGSDGFARGSISASSGAEILERVEITQSTFTNLNRALTLTPETNSSSDDTVTVRQSVVAMSPIFEESSEQYTEAGKSYYEQVSTADSGYAVATYSTVSLLGNFDSASNYDANYGISYLSNDDDIVPLATTYTWTGSGSGDNWSTAGNWDNGWADGNDATFSTSSSYTVTVDRDITAAKITVTGNTSYTFNYASGKSLSATGAVTIGNSNGSGSLTIAGGTNNTFSSTVYVGYASNSTGTLTITGGTNTFSGAFYVGRNGTGTLTITSGTNEFKAVYLGSGTSGGTGTGEFNILGGTNTFSGSYVDLGESSNCSGTLNIEDGRNTFSASVRVGYNASGTGEFTILGGTNNFSNYVYAGYSGTGYLTIEGGTNTFDASVHVGESGTGYLTIEGGTNTFTGLVVGENDGSTGTVTINKGSNKFTTTIHVGEKAGSNGTMEINGGTNTLSSSGNSVYIGESGTGKIEISDGTNKFEGSNVYVGYNSASEGTITITGGETTFSSSNYVYVGYNGTGYLTISGEETKTTFSSNVYVGYSGTGTMTITEGTTTISGATTIGSNGSLSIGDKEATGEATVYLETKIGTTTDGSVTISDNAKIILSGDLLGEIAGLESGSTNDPIPVIMANTISFGGITLDADTDLNSLVNQYVSAEGYQLTWKYDSGVLYVVSAAPIPEPSMFGLFFSLSAIGLVATRRRRRRA